MKDEFGTYLFDYQHEGQSWMLEIPARSREDAEARLAKLPWATYTGELKAKVPAQAGWLVRIWCWLCNRSGVSR